METKKIKNNANRVLRKIPQRTNTRSKSVTRKDNTIAEKGNVKRS